MSEETDVSGGIELVSLKARAYDLLVALQQLQQRHAQELAPVQGELQRVNEKIAALSAEVAPEAPG